jgi:hypothetical protein
MNFVSAGPADALFPHLNLSPGYAFGGNGGNGSGMGGHVGGMDEVGMLFGFARDGGDAAGELGGVGLWVGAGVRRAESWK